MLSRALNHGRRESRKLPTQLTPRSLALDSHHYRSQVLSRVETGPLSCQKARSFRTRGEGPGEAAEPSSPCAPSATHRATDPRTHHIQLTHALFLWLSGKALPRFPAAVLSVLGIRASQT